MVNIKSELTEKYDRYKRIIQHIPVGLLIVFLWVKTPELAIIFAVGFFIYQIMQFIHYLPEGGKKGWRDVAGALYGIGIGGALLFILRVLGVI